MEAALNAGIIIEIRGLESLGRSIIRGAEFIRLSVVIPEYNDWANTKQCLSSIFSRPLQYRPRIKVTVIVVCHGTDKSCLAEGPKCFPNALFLAGSNDEWWSATSNRGISYALNIGSTHIMLLNSDCRFVGDGFYRLLTLAEIFPGEILAPQQFDQSTGKLIPSYFRPLLRAGFISLPRPKTFREEFVNTQSPEEVFAISGGRGVIIPREVFSLVGLLDERSFPHYYGDHDFFLRCREIPIKQNVCKNIPIYVGERWDKSRASRSKSGGESVLPPQKLRHSHLAYRYVLAFFRKHYRPRKLYFIGIFLFYFRVVNIAFFRLIRSSVVRGGSRS